MWSQEVFVVTLGIMLCASAPHGDEMKKPPSDLVLRCEGSIIRSLPPQPSHSAYFSVNLTDCPPPLDTYSNSLEALNIDATAISRLTLERPNNLSQLRGSQFTGLQLKALSITNDDERDLVKLDDGLFNPLVATLRELYLWRVQMAPLPEDMELEVLHVKRGSALGPIGGCSRLRTLYVMHWVIPPVPGGWLANCPLVRELTMYHVMEQTVRHTLTGARSVESLRMDKCALLYVPLDLFADLVELRQLVFTNQSIYGLHPHSFRNLVKLEELDMSRNEMFATGEVAAALAPLPALKRLSLAENPLMDFCRLWTKPMVLQRLSLRSVGLSRLCFSEWTTLQHLDLSDNDIEALEFEHLPSSSETPFEVDLRQNPIKDLPRGQDAYRALVKKFNDTQSSTIRVLVNITLDCDCNYAWFARALRSLPRLSLVGARCETGEPLASTASKFVERLECDKVDCSGCVCRRSWQDNATTVDCRGAQLRGLPSLQGVERVRTLLAPSNVIDSLPEMLPESLKHIDLRDNRVAHAGGEAAEALFGSNRTVRLAGNPLVCDCDNLPLIAALLRHRAQVEDFDFLTCVNDGRPLGDVTLDLLCDDLEQLWPIVAILAVVGVVVTFSAALYCRFERQIKVFLYARGCCLSCLKEEEVNGRCEFDAFVSFSHEDDEFVNDHLLPGLSNYRICVHYRHWIAGDWIPAQIARSIERSKRTIIVLSKNFLESPWGMLEFRMAHASMLQEGRIRLIAIVLDDVIHDENLDPELRSYIHSNTYIKWGDPWFFDKLKYALPHHITGEKDLKASSVDVSNNSSQPWTLFGAWASMHT